MLKSLVFGALAQLPLVAFAIALPKAIKANNKQTLIFTIITYLVVYAFTLTMFIYWINIK